MISLSGKFRYFLCTDNVTLRFRHRGLREYIKSKLHRDPCNGDVYIFLSRDLSRLRIYYFHHNGEILAVKAIQDPTFFQWGKVYVLSTNQGCIVKRLFPDPADDMAIVCHSENTENYPDYKITKDDILHVGVVVGHIGIE